jgi:feruloyl esterase
MEKSIIVSVSTSRPLRGALSANDHVRNYATMTGIAKTLGLADPSTNTRLFIVPGASHGRGAALQHVDWASAIIDWVEQGSAPTQLTYSFTSGTTARTMPVCQQPKYPKYNGSGDLTVAANYTCT